MYLILVRTFHVLFCLGSLYPPLRKQDGADDYWALPPRPIASVLSYLDHIVEIFHEFSIELIAVTDGFDHPHKLETKIRFGDLAKTEDSLKNMWKQNGGKGFIHDYNESQKLKKQHTKVRVDILADVKQHLTSKFAIRFVGAPYEAEWQCVQLEKEGVVNGIYSIDSDCMALGARLVLHKLKQVKVDTGLIDAGGMPIMRIEARCSILRREAVMQRLSADMSLPELPHATFLSLANFMGNDYIRRIKSIGGKPSGTAGQLAKKWAALPNEQAKSEFLSSFNWTRVKETVYCKRGGKVDKYEERFNLASNIFLYCPVFKRSKIMHYIPHCVPA
jgi:hypothetical protein